MQAKRTVSFSVAVLIIINLVVGSGIFINLIPFLEQESSGNFLIYLLGGLIQLPVVITLARLASKHPDNGGLYVYAKTYISPFVGFLAGWTYFVGKSVSVGLMAHIFMSVLQSFFPSLQAVPHLALDISFLATLFLANVSGIVIQGNAQKVLILTKVIPVVAVLALLVWEGPVRTIDFSAVDLGDIGELLPIAVFATVGFEVMCTIAHMVREPKKNLMPIMVTGFGIVVALITIFQMGVNLLTPTAEVYSFPLGSIAHAYDLHALVPYAYICVYLSIIGGAFSIFTTNCWNLYTLAQNDHLPGKHYLMKLNSHHVPWVSLLFEAAIALGAVSMMQQQVSLQRMAVFGMVLSFLCAAVAGLLARSGRKRLMTPIVAGAALLSCTGISLWTLRGIYEVGVSVPYLGIYCVGIVLALWQMYRKQGKAA